MFKCKACGEVASKAEFARKGGQPRCPNCNEAEPEPVKQRLEYLRGELRAERISWGEFHELQSLAEYIDAGDVELLEAAGVPENHTPDTRN